MPGKRSSSGSRKEKPRNKCSQGQILSPETSSKNAKKTIAKKNKGELSRSENQTLERKVLVPKNIKVCEDVKNGKKKSKLVSTTKGPSELVEDANSKKSHKSKKIKLSSGSKKSTHMGGYDSGNSSPEDSSPEAKPKTKYLKVENIRSDSVPANVNEALKYEGVEEPGDTMSDHGDTVSDGADTSGDGGDTFREGGDTLGDGGDAFRDGGNSEVDGPCSDDCTVKCPKKKNISAKRDSLQKSAFVDSDQDDCDSEGDNILEQDNESEVESLSRDMIDDEAEEGSSEDDDSDESTEGYGMYFEAGSTLKCFKDTSYNSAREEEEMEADDEFVVSDTHIEYDDDEDDSWLDDEPEKREYSRIIIPPFEADSSIDEEEEEGEGGKLAGRGADKDVEHEENPHSDSEKEITVVQTDERADKSASTTGRKMKEQPFDKKRGKVGNSSSGGKDANAAATEVSNEPTGKKSGRKSRSPYNKLIQENMRIMREEYPNKKITRSYVLKLIIIRTLTKKVLLKIAHELIKSERC